MSFVFIIFIVIISALFILMFMALFFVSAFSSLVSRITHFFSGNREDCPFCGSKRSMQVFNTNTGHKKVCKKCKFSVEDK